MQSLGDAPKEVQIEVGTEALEDADEAQARESIRGEQKEDEAMRIRESDDTHKPDVKKSIKPPTQDEFLWVWKVCF